MKHKEGKGISFHNVIAFADCPYCRVPAGKECVKRKTKEPQDVPHLSRARKALKATEGMRVSE